MRDEDELAAIATIAVAAGLFISVLVVFLRIV